VFHLQTCGAAGKDCSRCHLCSLAARFSAYFPIMHSLHILFVECKHENSQRCVKNAVTLCGFCKNGRFGGTWRLHHQANVPSSPIHVTLMVQGLRSSETSVLAKVTLHHNPEDGILHSHRRENFKSYTVSRIVCGRVYCCDVCAHC
jgi:hypothetical protein